MAASTSNFFDKFPEDASTTSILNLDKLLQFAAVVIEFCDLQGKALYPVKSDVGGNIKKIEKSRQKYQVNTVEEMLSVEQINKHPDGEMQDICRTAYSNSLMKHHNVIMKTAFYVGLGLFPDRETFLLRLAYNKPNMDDVVMTAVRNFVERNTGLLSPIEQLLISYGVESAPVASG